MSESIIYAAPTMEACVRGVARLGIPRECVRLVPFGGMVAGVCARLIIVDWCGEFPGGREREWVEDVLRCRLTVEGGMVEFD